MRISCKGLLVVFMLASVVGLAACNQEGPAEKAGKKVDKAVVTADKKIEQATEQAGKKIEQANEQADKKIEQATEQADKKIEKVGDELSDKSKKFGESMDDAAITVKVKAAIANDPVIKLSQISVTTTNGVVRLSGVVDSPQSIDRALEIARNVKNVNSTENNLVVKSAK